MQFDFDKNKIFSLYIIVNFRLIKKKFTKQITKTKKQEFYADNDISFKANDGEILGILGPNGAGKTTLLRIIAGILEPTSGSVNFDKLNYDKNQIEDIEKTVMQNRFDLFGENNLFEFKIFRFVDQ